jgi:signal transduction histidine kinase
MIVTRSLKGKLVLSYLAVTLVTVLIISLLIRFNSGRSLTNLLIDQQTSSMAEAVQTYYLDNGSLSGFHEYYAQQSGGGKGQSGQGTGYGANSRRDNRQLTGLVDNSNLALIPSLGYTVGQEVPENAIKDSVPVEVDGQVIARIFADTTKTIQLNPEEARFIERTNLAIGLAAIAGTLVAVLIGFLLSGRLLKPIRLLTQASKSLSKGEYRQQIPVASTDELGELTSTFNQMSLELARADEQRKRLTADITHDLSTPLQILSGYVEMVKEDQVALTPQRIDIMSTEIEHLKRLVGDLTILTQAETGSLQILLEPVQPEELQNHIFNTYQPIAEKQQVNLALDLHAELPKIMADEVRMHQVIKNLVENALRYTHAGGILTLSAYRSEDQVFIGIQDTGSGIAGEDLPYVFERFYRADKARGGNSGKMGLGLAICKALVEAQGGSIRVESEGIGKGSKFLISFKPLK